MAMTGDAVEKGTFSHVGAAHDGDKTAHKAQRYNPLGAFNAEADKAPAQSASVHRFIRALCQVLRPYL
jgi:hypothetical protein